MVIKSPISDSIAIIEMMVWLMIMMINTKPPYIMSQYYES